MQMIYYVSLLDSRVSVYCGVKTTAIPEFPTIGLPINSNDCTVPADAQKKTTGIGHVSTLF